MNKHTLIVIIFILAALGGAWYFFGGGSGLSLDGEHVDEVQLTREEVEAELQGGTTEKVDEDTQRYTNASYGFSFEYPTGLSISTIPDLGGETVLVRGEEQEFQIYISPFDEPGPVTPQRIKQDLPNLTISEPQQVLIGTEKDITALIFLGESEDFGKTREVWFVKNGHLYQVIAEAGSDAFVGPVLETLRFQE